MCIRDSIGAGGLVLLWVYLALRELFASFVSLIKWVLRLTFLALAGYVVLVGAIPLWLTVITFIVFPPALLIYLIALAVVAVGGIVLDENASNTIEMTQMSSGTFEAAGVEANTEK